MGCGSSTEVKKSNFEERDKKVIHFTNYFIKLSKRNNESRWIL
jgi:hypothetical protein